MRAAFRVQTLVGDAEPLDWTPEDEVFPHDLFRVFELHMTVPDGVGVHNNRGSVLALVQASGLVNPHLRTQTGFARKMLQPRV
jgi:hypothetical protein